MLLFLLFSIDMERIDLSKEEFFDLLIKNDLFIILNEYIAEKGSEDKEFVVCFYKDYLLYGNFIVIL